MRIQFVAESFLPHVSGVTTSVLQVTDHLSAAGHDVSIIAPQARGCPRQLHTSRGHRIRVHQVASLPVPGYASVRLATARTATVRAVMESFAPDVVHLASPAVLGARALSAAERLGVPAVGVFQTDLAGFSRSYALPFLEQAAWPVLRDIHQRTARTLAPSRATRADLLAHGIPRVHLWGRGVDTSRFTPAMASRTVRRSLAEDSERIVLYVGRLAPEKQVADLAVLHDMPGVRLVIVGDGPQREALMRRLPRARFLGLRRGGELAALYASADLLVHTGPNETFCQVIQEAMASGLPAIAPAAGGPLDLIAPSRTGWLYTPGMLDELREHAADLLFDDAKRRAFGQAALESVSRRTWPVLTEQLLGHLRAAIAEPAPQRRRQRLR